MLNELGYCKKFPHKNLSAYLTIQKRKVSPLGLRFSPTVIILLLLTGNTPMIKPHVTLATQEHVNELAEKLRPADINEVYLPSGMTIHTELTESLKLSKYAWAIHYKNEVVGVFGVVDHPTDNDTGIPWLLSTEKLNDCSLSFIKECVGAIDVMHILYKTLITLSHEGHLVAHKWLKRCGFEAGNKHENIGIENTTFIEFKKVSEYV